jgi:hypothetical protein
MSSNLAPAWASGVEAPKREQILEEGRLAPLFLPNLCRKASLEKKLAPHK